MSSTSLRAAMGRPPRPRWFAPIPGLDQGFKIVYAWGLFLDATIEACLQGLQARLPGYGTPTALPRLGRDRGIRRGYNETDDSFAARLPGWITDRKTKGNPYTLMRQVRAYLSPHKPLMRVVNNNGTWYTLNPDDTVERVKTLPTKNWDWDGQDSLHSRFWLIIYPPNALAVRDGTWGDGETWGSKPNSTWGSTFSLDQVTAIREIVADWKSAGAVCGNIVISFDAAAFDPTGASPPLPDGFWGHWSKNVGGVQVSARDPRAIYWDGVA